VAIYLDHNATTPLRPEVVESMAECWGEDAPYRNPSSLHALGRAANRKLAESRAQVAQALGAGEGAVVFTSGGSEADNLALQGAFFASELVRPHIITSQIEHPAVLRTCQWLERRGARVTYLPVDEDGVVAPESVAAALDEDTILVSIMHANNVVGTIQPIAEIGALTRERGVPLHTDAVQTVGKIAVNVEELQCDLLSLSAHKFYGPPGIGALYVRDGVKLAPLVHGGGQEGGRRAGTENLPGIVGLARALELALDEREELTERFAVLRKPLEALAERLPAVKILGRGAKRLPQTVALSFLWIDGMALTLNLSRREICVSQGSACASGKMEPSHVVRAMGLTDLAAHGSLRLSLGRSNTLAEIEYVVEQIVPLVEKLRLVTAPEDIGQCDENCVCFTRAEEARIRGGL